jgi:hypothetical protein
LSILSYQEGLYRSSGENFRVGFNRKENKYYAYLKNTSAPVAGEIHFGDQMTGIKGFYSVVTMSTDSTTDFGGEKQLFQIGTEYNFNNGFYQNG